MLRKALLCSENYLCGMRRDIKAPLCCGRQAKSIKFVAPKSNGTFTKTKGGTD